MKPKLLLIIGFCISFACAFHTAFAQAEFLPPPGFMNVADRSGMSGVYESSNFFFDGYAIYRRLSRWSVDTLEKVFETGMEIKTVYLEKRKIEEVFFTSFYLVIQFYNGSYYRLKLTFHNDFDRQESELTALPLPPAGTQPTKLAGDDLYCFVDFSVYVLRDQVNGPWLPNNNGLPESRTLQDMNIDSFQNVWLLCNNRLYMQPLTSSTWTLKSNLSGNQRLFIDRFQKIWLGRVGNVVFTTNQGTTMEPGPTGIGAGELVQNLSTDYNGDVYVMTYINSYPFNKIYRSAGGTANFVRIDQNLATQFTQYGSDNIYNGIFADTGLFVAHGAGLHVTKDAGATWQYIPGPPSESAFGVVASNDNQLMMSTTAGVFKGNNGNWTKKHPSAGFQTNIKLFRAANGNIYAQGERIIDNSTSSPRYAIYKSTDNGNTFLPDSAGLGVADVGMDAFYVDETGTQHAAGYLFVAGIGGKMTIWKKPPGQPWVPDMGGFPTIYYGGIRSFSGDGHGNIHFHFYNESFYRFTVTRSVTGTTWTEVSQLSLMGVSDQAGRSDGVAVFGVVAAGSDNPGGLIKKTGNNFTDIPLPPGIIAGNINTASVTFDSSGALWAYFSLYPFNPPPVPPNAIETGSGLFYTTDFVTWKKPNNDMDTALFRSIRAIGDSVFAMPQNFDGVYVFKKLAAGILYTFTGNGNWTEPTNWLNSLMPPAVLPAGSEIIIQPAGNGECILNTSQTVSAGGKFTVSDTKKLKIIGALNILQ